MRVIFTCGGTAGHVNPALALAGLMRQRQRNVEILFVGANRGIERRLIEQAGYPFQAVEVSSFHRSLRPKELRHNLISLRNYFLAPRQARKILRTFRPDLVVGTGGYASYPMVRAASGAHIPTAVHESNAIPGLTTKLLEPYADVIMVGFEDCRKNYRHPERVRVTGTPVRGDFFALTKEQAKELKEELLKTKSGERILIEESAAMMGGGSLPGEKIPSYALTITPQGESCEAFAKRLRNLPLPVICHIKEEKIFLDMRTVMPKEKLLLLEGIKSCLRTDSRQ